MRPRVLVVVVLLLGYMYTHSRSTSDKAYDDVGVRVREGGCVRPGPGSGDLPTNSTVSATDIRKGWRRRRRRWRRNQPTTSLLQPSTPSPRLLQSGQTKLTTTQPPFTPPALIPPSCRPLPPPTAPRTLVHPSPPPSLTHTHTHTNTCTDTQTA